MISWTPAQIERYQDLMRRGGSMTWAKRAKLCFPDCRLGRKASSASIEEAERRLGRELPQELKALFAETDGIFDNRGDWLVHSLDYLIEDILGLWEIDDLYMAPRTMILFGGPGNGDRYFIPVLPNGVYSECIFLWDHETDSREWIAQSFSDYFYRISLELEERYT
jgi:cell wall assembly regulator SMI1